MGVRADIIAAIKTRLESITAANGYGTDVKKVYGDEIPMGIQMNEYELPAIFILDRDQELSNNLQLMDNTWFIDLQLWHNRVADSVMFDFQRDVFKALYANSPTADRYDAFRGLHPAIVTVKPLSTPSDLNMIEANRVNEISLAVRYRAKFHDM